MNDLKIISGEPFKAKVLMYSESQWNKVVKRYMNLYKVNDYVYLAEEGKSNYNHMPDDLFYIILKVNGIYVNAGSYNRWMIEGESKGELMDKALQKAKSYVEDIFTAVKEKSHIQLLYVSLFEELGFDTNPLWAVREERERMKKEQEKEEATAKKKRELEAKEAEKERLDKVKQQFQNDEYISADDFLALCKQDGVDIHIRTIGTFNKYVRKVQISGGIEYIYHKRKKPKFDGCFKVIAEYRKHLTQNR